MKIKIKPDAAKIFWAEVNKRCGEQGVPGPHEKSYHRSLQKIAGRTIEVETDHLFPRSFNSAPIPETETVGAVPRLDIQAEYVEEVIDDARIGKAKCLYCGESNPTDDIEMMTGCPNCGGTTFHVFSGTSDIIR